MHMLVSLKNVWHVKCHNDKFHTSNQLKSTKAKDFQQVFTAFLAFAQASGVWNMNDEMFFVNTSRPQTAGGAVSLSYQDIWPSPPSSPSPVSAAHPTSFHLRKEAE